MILPQQSLNPKIKPKWRGSLGMVESAVAYNCRIHGFPAPVLAMPFWGGAGDTVYDVSGQRYKFRSTSGWFYWRENGLYSDGTTDIFMRNSLLADKYSNNFSVCIGCTPTATHQIDMEATTGTTGTSGQRYATMGYTLLVDSAATLISVGTNGISVYEHANIYMPPLCVYSGTVRANSNIVHICVNRQHRLYLNGTLVRTGLTSPKSNVYSSDGLYFPHVAYGPLIGFLYYKYIFSTVLTATQIKFLHDNPYFMFQPMPVPYRYAAPVGGLSIPVAMHHYQHNIRI